MVLGVHAEEVLHSSFLWNYFLVILESRCYSLNLFENSFTLHLLPPWTLLVREWVNSMSDDDNLKEEVTDQYVNLGC